MTKQEFLAFSLPYKLFFIIEYGSTNQPTGIYQMSGVYETSVVEGFNYDNNVKTDKLKPILHPLSDLTKEIEHKGEKFVPLHRLLENNYFNLTKMSEEDILAFEETFMMPGLITLHDLPLYLKWHFDLFNGIESGDAIDVNQLQINPYK